MAKVSKRKFWKREETLLFLSCYANRKTESDHTRKKKFAYAHVLEDMVYQGFSDSTVTPLGLEARMRTLLNAYKNAKDNMKQTGAAASVVPYWDEMEELFGDNPTITNMHAGSTGALPTSAKPSPATTPTTINISYATVASTLTSSATVDRTPATSSATVDPTPATSSATVVPTPATPSATVVPTPATSSATVAANKCASPLHPKRRRLSAKEMYYETKL